MNTIATIGYEGATLSDFVATLLKADIREVIDIRAIPQSRRPGFSKTSLSAALASAEILYRHVRDLGDPKPGRDAARSGDLKRFTELFTAHLDTHAAQLALEQVAHTVDLHKCVLLCYEREPTLCHRLLVAKRLAAGTSLNIQNLGVAKHLGCTLETYTEPFVEHA